MGLGWMCETKAVNGWHHLPMIVGQAGFLPGLEIIMRTTSNHWISDDYGMYPTETPLDI